MADVQGAVKCLDFLISGNWYSWSKNKWAGLASLLRKYRNVAKDNGTNLTFPTRF